MHKNSKIISLIIVLINLFLFTLTCNASNIVEINQLIENTITYDNKEVTIQGELIGEALERDKYAWVNINDTTNAIGIWVKQEDIKQVQYYGDYKHKGDIVKVTGTFYRACPEHGGDTDIHCTKIEIVQKGNLVKEKVSHNKVITAAVLILIAILTLLVYFKLTNRPSKKHGNIN